MTDQTTSQPQYEPVPLVIADGDEGVQLNTGRRFAFLGAGFRLDNFTEVLSALKKTLEKGFPADFQKELRIAASEENALVKAKLELNDWDEVNASMQQHIEALADKNGILYSGILPFADPEELPHGVKGHMVRPHNMHLANKVCLTLAGGEEVYNLGQFLISADWLAEFTANGTKNMEEAKSFIQVQIDFYSSLVGGNNLQILTQEDGPLSADLAADNKKVFTQLNFS